MKDDDFVECEFIDRAMRFLTFYDFVRECSRIKQCFQSMSANGRQFYMWYIYANIHMSEFYKGLCWDFLNDYATYGDLLYQQKFYKVR